MNNYLKNILYFLVIWGVEMVAAWICIDYFFPHEPKQFSHSVSYGHTDSTFPMATETAEIAFYSQKNPLSSLPVLMTGKTQEEVIAALGEPTWRKPGYWSNSVAWSYENMLSLGIDLGLLFDTDTKKIRQAEVAAPSKIKLESLFNIMDILLDYTPAKVEQKLESVYWRKTNDQMFSIDNLEAVIQRNDRDRIYIGVWEADFH